MADQKITELTELTTVATGDILAIVDDPAGSPITKKMSLETLFANIAVKAGTGITMADDTWIGIGAALERIVFNAAGDVCVMGANLGIGTLGPGAGLDVVGSGSSNIIRNMVESNHTTEFYWQRNESGGSYNTIWSAYVPASSTDLRFYNGGDRVTIQAGGNVGIGTPGPNAKLEIKGTDNDSSMLFVYNSAAANTANRAGIAFAPGADFGASGWTSAPYVKGYMETAGVPWKAGLQFGTYGADWGGLVTRMTIDGSGNVGIGTPGPDRREHAEVSDAVTAAVTNIQRLTHASTGTVANNFGLGVEHELEAADGNNYIAALVETVWATAAAATRKAQTTFSVYDTAAREALRLEASGSAAMIGFLGAAAQARKAHIVDADGSIEDITTKFNTLLSYLESYGLIATS